MITALASGAFLGLSCGLAPGPLLALLLAQTLRHGPREGCKIALTPLVSLSPKRNRLRSPSRLVDNT